MSQATKRMLSAMRPVPLAGSEPPRIPGQQVKWREPNAREVVRVTVVVRARSSMEERHTAVRELHSRLPHERRHLSHEEFEPLHGAAPEDLAKVEAFARANELRVVESSAAKDCVVLSGTIGAVGKAFTLKLMNAQTPDGTYLTHQGPICIPASLDGIVVHVLGLDNRPMPPRRLVLLPPDRIKQTEPPQVASVYEFPTDADGEGECVGIITLEGGFHEEDLKAYFARHGHAKPKITIVEVDGQHNSPASREDIESFLRAQGMIPAKGKGEKPAPLSPEAAHQTGWTIETTTDIELVGRFANRAHIVVYFAPNNTQGKYHAFNTALTDQKNRPSVISCSWGMRENLLPRRYLNMMDDVFRDAALRGITICCASGDDGSSADSDGEPQVHFPASSPHVLACGGTHLTFSETGVEEFIWSETLEGQVLASGGGASRVFSLPEWQHGARVEHKAGRSGRGVPDVAGKADMTGGYGILVGGHDIGVGGTSSAAPMWAALTALLNQKLGKSIGYLTPLLYSEAFRSALKEVTRGRISEGFVAGSGWNPATGLGRPRGTTLLAALHKKGKP